MENWAFLHHGHSLKAKRCAKKVWYMNRVVVLLIKSVDLLMYSTPSPPGSTGYSAILRAFYMYFVELVTVTPKKMPLSFNSSYLLNTPSWALKIKYNAPVVY